MKLNNPIYIKLTSFGNLNTYVYYKIELFYPINSWSIVYNGRSFIDSSGSSKMRIDQILRDYIFNWTLDYNTDLHKYEPKNTVYTINVEDIKMPIEKSIIGFSGSFQNTDVKVSWSTDNTNWTVLLNCPMAVLYNGIDIDSPYSTNGGYIASDYNRLGQGSLTIDENGEWEFDDGSVIAWDDNDPISFGNTSRSYLVPHLPRVQSSNIYLSSVFYIPDDQFVSNQPIEIEIDNVNTIDTFIPSTPGNYNLSIPLNLIYDQDAVCDKIIMRYGTEETDLVELDSCPSPYYLVWVNDFNTWFSWGFNGKEITNKNNNTIENYESRTIVYKVERYKKWELWTDFINKKQLDILGSVINTKTAYIYIVEKDVSIPVNITTSSLDKNRNNSSKPYSLNVVVEEDRKTLI